MMDSTLGGYNWVDLTIIGIVFLSLLVGLTRGFVKEAISLGTWIVAIWIAMQFHGALAEFLAKWIQTPSIRTVISFMILLLITIILGGILNSLLYRIIHGIGLGPIDRIIGGIFGFFRGLLIIGLFVMFLRDTQIVNDTWWQHSSLIPRFMPLADTFVKFMPKEVQDLKGQQVTPKAKTTK
jgi:membrane protein required for colicin V production